ncbi:MAG: Spy/CpxP family protein refolding chaperone [Bacteroidetes bacterium]|nr:Spy/CpxP family protein refolding chaperone [Bacteroidota bacterium]MBX7046763.1 Spy/CpxP family protein refolding chaperone [Ignavibacteria bacterium]
METIAKNKLLFTVIIILILINVSTLSFMWYAKLKEPPPPVIVNAPPMQQGPPPEGRANLKEQLKLTDAQMEAVDKIREEHLAQIRKTKEEMRGLKDELFSNLSKPDADTNKVKDITNRIGTYEARIDLITFDNFREIRKIISDEQKKKFDEIILDLLRMGPPHERGPGGLRRGPPGMMPGEGPPPIRDGDGHRNPPDKEGPPPK